MSNHYKTHIDDQMEECKNVWFQGHKATINLHHSAAIIINWQNPNSWNYGCQFIIHRRWLTVLGDIGEAIYEWGQELTINFLEGLDFGYFKSKCAASEVGRKFDDWDEKIAENVLSERVGELHKNLAEEDPDENSQKELDVIEFIGRASKQEYAAAAMEYYDSSGDAEGSSSISDMGKIAHPRCIGHFIGLQMAIAQLKSK